MNCIRNKIVIIILVCAGSILFNAGVFAQTESTDKSMEEALSAEKTIDKDLEKYTKAVEDDPDSDIAHYNLGTAYYRSGQYEKSIDSFMRSLNTEDRELEAKAVYNMANTKYKMGTLHANKDLNSAIEHYRESLDYYKRAMDLDESDRDAKYNHELVEKKMKILLDQMKNQQQQQDQNQDQSNENEDEQGEGEGSQQRQDKEQQDEEQQSAEQRQPQQNQSQEESGAGQEQDEQQTQSAGKEEESPEEMSPEEARMLLEAYGQDEAREEVRKQLTGRHGEVLKDW